MRIESKIEGVLLAYGEPIGMEKLSKAIRESKEDTQKAVESLRLEYEDRERGCTLIQNGNSIQLVSSSSCAEYIKRLKKVDDETALSPATLEVLSIIAYRSPITRLEIEAIRGVHCGSVLRSLALRNLVERKELPGDGRSYVYTPSVPLLSLLGVHSVQELPEYEQLSGHEKLQSHDIFRNAE